MCLFNGRVSNAIPIPQPHHFASSFPIVGYCIGTVTSSNIAHREFDQPLNVANLPSNLLDDLTDESGALAQVALGARNTGLDNAGGGLLYGGKKTNKCQRPSSAAKVCSHLAEEGKAEGSRDPPRGETVTAHT